MRPLYAVVVGVLGLAFVAAGCGGAIPSSNGGPATLRMTRSSLGSFLVDGQGHTLYLFEKDQRGESYCGGACAAVWPPFETSSKPSASAGIDGAALGTIKRSDGDMQVTYHGHPFYAGDASSPGNTSGEEVSQFGSEWYLLAASGQPLEAKHSPGSSNSNSGYGNTGSGSNSGVGSNTNSGSNTGSGSSGGGSWG
jgi:predicted lipoprotein with Yx(FWY)xxD motif